MATARLDVRVLSLVNEERNAYGLRLNEYGRYRAHCLNKIRRLRQKLKLTHGKGREFKKTSPVPAENIVDGHLHLLLYEAERAWAYSQELTQSPEAKDDGAFRHRATGRFRRAVHHAAELLSQAQSIFPSRLSAASFLEITSYFLTLQGRFFLRRDDFQPALQHLSVSRSLLDELTRSANTSRDQALYTLFSDEIAPQIRFAAHSLGRSKAYDIDTIVAEISPRARSALVPQYDEIVAKLVGERSGERGDKGRATLRELTWEGQPVPIRNPELVDVFLKVQNAELALGGTDQSGKSVSTVKSGRAKVSAYDGVLLALTDAEAVARKLVETQELSTGSQAPSASGTRDVHFIHAFTVFRLLARRVERDLLLVESLSLPPAPKTRVLPPPKAKQAVGKAAPAAKGKEKEDTGDPRVNPGLVKLYDTILQSLEQMRSLSVVDESIDLVPSVEAKLAYSKAKRVLYLSRTYASLKKYAEALALSAKVHIYLREAGSILSSSNPNAEEDTFYPLTGDDIVRAEAELTSDEHRAKTDWYTLNGGRLDTDPTIYVPQKKPVFFDVAFNYVDLPMDNLLARSKKPAKSPAPAIPAAAAPTTAPSEKSTDTRKEREKRATKVEQENPPEAEVKIVSSAPSLVSGILGGWWGRK